MPASCVIAGAVRALINAALSPESIRSVATRRISLPVVPQHFRCSPCQFRHAASNILLCTSERRMDLEAEPVQINGYGHYGLGQLRLIYDPYPARICPSAPGVPCHRQAIAALNPDIVY